METRELSRRENANQYETDKKTLKSIRDMAGALVTTSPTICNLLKKEERIHLSTYKQTRKRLVKGL